MSESDVYVDNPCQGRCEFHGRLYCKEWGGTCEEFVEAGRLLAMTDGGAEHD